MNLALAKAAIEAMIFASLEPVTAKTMAEALGLAEHTVRQLALDLAEEYRQAKRGIQISETGAGYSFLTHPECAQFVEKLQRVPRHVPLSQAALETLAIVAYRQPITRAEIDFVRGVRSESALLTLIDRGLVEEKGRREAPGRPILYGTTKEFLRYFGLKDLSELPSLQDWMSAPRERRGNEDETAATEA